MKKVNLLLMLLAVVLTGCATIIHGEYQRIAFSSTPPGALVYIDGMPHGKTPVFIDLHRKNEHFVRIELPGYIPHEMPIIKTTDGWVWGNILLGGLIGLGVDAITGAMYKLAPEHIYATLQKEGVSSLYQENGLYVFVVLEPDTDWQKIGELQRTN